MTVTLRFSLNVALISQHVIPPAPYRMGTSVIPCPRLPDLVSQPHLFFSRSTVAAASTFFHPFFVSICSYRHRRSDIYGALPYFLSLFSFVGCFELSPRAPFFQLDCVADLSIPCYTLRRTIAYSGRNKNRTGFGNLFFKASHCSSSSSLSPALRSSPHCITSQALITPGP